MGFFDSLKAICDTRRWYTEDNLYLYFLYEIYDRINTSSFKYEVSTNIRKIINDSIVKYFPNAYPVESKIENAPLKYQRIQKVDDTIYKIVYIGKITVYDAYENFLGFLYYRVIVYTDKYACSSNDANQKTTVEVSKTPLE